MSETLTLPQPKTRADEVAEAYDKAIEIASKDMSTIPELDYTKIVVELTHQILVHDWNYRNLTATGAQIAGSFRCL